MLESLQNTLRNFLNSIVTGLGNVIFAIIILLVALVVANIVKNLVIKGLKALKLKDKLASFGITNSDKLIDLVAKIVWLVVFLLFLPAVFGQVGMASITAPISALVSTMVGYIPNLLAAGILMTVGVLIADIAAQVVTPIIKATKVDNAVAKLGVKAPVSAIAAKVIKVIIVLFFAIQAINVLGITVLSAAGAAIIGYIPAILSSIIIAVVAIFAGSTVEKLIVKANPKSKGLAAVIKVIIYVFAVFMVLSQLGFATELVTKSFVIVLTGVSIAIAIAFGVGGRDFAKHMLEKLEKKIDDNN